MTDGLGRLDEVTEFPGTGTYVTTYGYDVLDNLTSVTQGSQGRTFAYDSLSRLICASNPESRGGSASCTGTPARSDLDRYTYDDNGNLVSKTDARSVTTTYTYDELNRPKTKTGRNRSPSILAGGHGRGWSWKQEGSRPGIARELARSKTP